MELKPCVSYLWLEKLRIAASHRQSRESKLPQRDEQGAAVLSYAAKKGAVAIPRDLLEQNALFDPPCDEGLTPSSQAVCAR